MTNPKEDVTSVTGFPTVRSAPQDPLAGRACLDGLGGQGAHARGTAPLRNSASEPQQLQGYRAVAEIASGNDSQFANWKKNHVSWENHGKSTISIANFHGYVKLPGGM